MKIKTSAFQKILLRECKEKSDWEKMLTKLISDKGYIEYMHMSRKCTEHWNLNNKTPTKLKLLFFKVHHHDSESTTQKMGGYFCKLYIW